MDIRTYTTESSSIVYHVSRAKRKGETWLVFLPGLTADHRLFERQLGHFDDNHIADAYVHAAFQGNGCGTLIIDKLEEVVAVDHDVAILGASLPAACLCKQRDCKTTGHGVIELNEGVKLICEKMGKRLR